MAVATHDGRTSVVVNIFVGPLPHVAHHVHYSKWAGSIGMCIDIAGRSHLSSVVSNGCRSILWIASRITGPSR